MDYEKEYKEALERARKIHNETEFDYEKGILEEIFPELKESEDEKIRKTLIEMFSSVGKKDWRNIPTEKIIAWLEKQGESKESDPRQENLDDLLYADDVYQMAMNDAMVEEAKSKAINALSELKISKLLGLTALKAVNEEKVDNKTCVKPTDNVEAKFKKGDWILYSGDNYEGVRHITKIDEDGYHIERNGLPHGIIPFNHEICMRPWTINDAREGDVLISNDEVFIFAHRKQLYPIAVAHCFVDSEGGFHLDGEFGYSKEGWLSIHPATREQRDLLFSEIGGAGYEWDSVNKRLRNINPKPAWTEEDEKMVNDIIAAIDTLYYHGMVNWLKALKGRIGYDTVHR